MYSQAENKRHIPATRLLIPLLNIGSDPRHQSKKYILHVMSGVV